MRDHEGNHFAKLLEGTSIPSEVRPGITYRVSRAIGDGGVIVGASGNVVFFDGRKKTMSVIDGAPDLSAAAIDEPRGRKIRAGRPAGGA